MNYEDDFPMLKKDFIYFDNAATTFKPNSVINKEFEYYTNYTSNVHRGDYNISFKANDEVEESRMTIQNFINAKSDKEIIFTSGTTEGLNEIVNDYFKYHLKEKDEVIISRSEHASNVLPWLRLKETNKVIIKYIPLLKNGKLNLKELKKMITRNTKVISLAYITNVIGDVRDIKKIVKIAHKNNILVVVDAAQSIAHIKTDVQDLDCDFLTFSFHKMYGPTGVGVLYAKENLLEEFIPTKLGGGMNESFSDEKIVLNNLPTRLEAGTINISGIIASKEAINYIGKIGFKNIEKKERELKEYFINKIKKYKHIKIYNKDTEASIIILKVKDVFSSDVSLYLNSKNICVRTGEHCAKMLKEENNINDTVRISFSFYNSFKEIDKLVETLKDYESIKNY